jgi:DNA-binding transcriptional regulator YhcF (GntR family)
MLPFRVQFKEGPRTYDQVVYAVKKAIIAGILKQGDRFASVRTMSQELGINHNTAQKVVAALIDEGLLVVTPGVGTVVAEAPPPSREDLKELLGSDLERVVVEAQRLQLECGELTRAIEQHWVRLKGKP